MNKWKINDAVIVPYAGDLYLGRVIAIVEDGRVIARFRPFVPYSKEVDKIEPKVGDYIRVFGHWRPGVKGWFSSEPDWVFCPAEI